MHRLTKILLPSGLTWGTMDAVLFCNTSSPGTTLTVPIMANCSVSSSSTGPLAWTLSGGFTGFAIQASQGGLGGSITVNGTTYPSSSTTQSMGYADTPSFTAVTSAGGTTTFGSVNPPIVVANGYITPGPADAGFGDGLFDFVGLFDNSGSGHFAVMQMRNGNCDGSGTVYGLRIETDGSGILHSPCITVTPGHRYSYSFLFDETNGTSKLAIFDPSSAFAQVGSTVTVAQKTGAGLNSWIIGNNQGGSSTGTTYFEDSMLDWTNHTFPNKPH